MVPTVLLRNRTHASKSLLLVPVKTLIGLIMFQIVSQQTLDNTKEVEELRHLKIHSAKPNMKRWKVKKEVKSVL